jgi:hypothetical protein
MPKPVTLDHLLSQKKATTETVEIVLDPELAEELAEARKTRDAAAARASVRTTDSEAPAQMWEAEETVARLERKVEEEEVAVYFTFRSIGRAAFDSLVAAHPAGAEQRARLKRFGVNAEDVPWDEESFPPAIIAASLVEPKLTEAEVRALWHADNWNQAELSALVIAAIKVNGVRRTADLGKGSRKTQPSGRS